MKLHYQCRACGEQRTVTMEDGHVELGYRNGQLAVLELETLPACDTCAVEGNLREVLDASGSVVKRQVQFLDKTPAGLAKRQGGVLTRRHGRHDGNPSVRDAE